MDRFRNISFNLESIKKKYKHYVPVSQRLILSIFGFLAIVNASTMRHCMDIALTQMVTEPNQILTRKSHKNNKSALSVISSASIRNFIERYQNMDWRLPKNVTTTANKTMIAKISMPKTITKTTAAAAAATTTTTTTITNGNIENVGPYKWSMQLQTIILTSFYVGYALSHVPGGRLAERYGGKWILAIGILLTAILTLLTPYAIKVGGVIALIIIRLIMGLSEGPTVPALSAMLAQWVPPNERGKLGSLVLSGGQVGIFFVNIVSSLLLRKFEWCYVFYIFGGCALIWFICFTLLCYSDPESNPFIEEPEKQYLHKKIGIVLSKTALPPTPWKDILTSTPMLALISATVQYDWTQIQLDTQVPEFIQNIGNISLSESFIESLSDSTPYILNWLVSVISGVISDILVNRHYISRTTARRSMTFLTAMGPGIVTSLTHCYACSEEKDIRALYNCAIAVMGTYYSGIKLTPLDMSPNYAGTLTGISNGLGSLTGAVVPWFENYLELSDSSPFNELRTAFWLICSALTTGEVQRFNQLPNTNDYNAIKN